tara:strand:- start:2049 stop:2261 length:213 start_codon:yes stop_codon:yes gene_type:complete
MEFFIRPFGTLDVFSFGKVTYLRQTSALSARLTIRICFNKAKTANLSKGVMKRKRSFSYLSAYRGFLFVF